MTPELLKTLKKEGTLKTTPAQRKLEIALLDPVLGRTIAKHKHTPPEVLSQLMKSPDMPTRKAVADNPSALPEHLEHLAGDGQWTVLKAVAQHPLLPETVQLKLARHKRHTVREALASRSDLCDLACEILVQDREKEVRMAVVRSQEQLLGRAVEALVQSDDLALKAEALWRHADSIKALPAQVQLHFLQHPAPRVRRVLPGVARTFGLFQTRAEVEAFLQDPDPVVRASLYKAPWVLEQHPALFEVLLQDPSEKVRILGFLSPDLRHWDILLSDPQPWVREVAVQRLEHLPEDQQLQVVLRLTTDPDLNVRMALACSDLPFADEVLQVLLQDPSPEVRQQAVQRSDMVLALLSLAQQDPVPEVRREVLGQAIRHVLMEEDAERAIHMLQAFLEDPCPTVFRTWGMEGTLQQVARYHLKNLEVQQRPPASP